jgi:predicted ATPase/DNA-binding XRE family transcriptional regulator
MGSSFGELLRRSRERSSLSQQELAERAGLTVNGVSQLERGVRIRPYPHTVRALADALELDDDERAQLLAAIPPRGRATGGGSSPRPAPPLPALEVEPIGRDGELAELLQALASHRLVSLTGPGGVGKTTLALAAAHATVDRYPGGVTFVELADVDETALALLDIGRHVGLVDSGGIDVRAELPRALRGSPRLLVLDNVEQLPGLPAELAHLLGEVAELHVLATSRAPLRLRLEHELPVGPLAPPPAADHGHLGDAEGEAARASERILTNDAVRLLLARAGTRADDAVTDAPALATICRRVDGLPLGIELAAAWLRVLTPRELADRLTDPLDLLVDGPRDLPPRHRGLRDAIAWSEARLDADARRLFRRLGVLPATWDLETAALVVDLPEAQVLRGVALLVERNLVLRVGDDPDGRARFRLLETVRAYSREQLEAHDDAEGARSRFAEAVQEFARDAGARLDGPEQGAWLDRVEARLPDVRAALTWALQEGAADLAARCYAPLMWSWYLRHATEGDTWGRAILTCSSLGSSAHIGAATTWALVALGRGQEEAAVTTASMAADTALDDDVEGALRALAVLANAAAATGDAERTDEAARRVAALHGPAARRASDGTVSFAAAAHAAATLAQVRIALATGALDRAEQLLDEADVRVGRAGTPWLRALWLNIAAGLDLTRGRFDRTTPRLLRAIDLSRELGDAPATLYALTTLAVAAALRGRARDAACVFGAADAHAARTGQRINDPATDVLAHDQRARAEQALGVEAFTRALAEGASLTIEQVLERHGRGRT